MDIKKIQKFANIYADAAKKKKGLKPSADGMMKGKTHPWQHCYNKMKDKIKSPEAFCAKMKDLHKGNKDWRSTKGLKNSKDDKSKVDDIMLALDYTQDLAKAFINDNN